MDENENKGKVHKPAKDHPWRNAPSSKAIKWAKDSTGDGSINNFKKGGGHKPWNGR